MFKGYMLKVMQLFSITNNFEYKVFISSNTRFNLFFCAPSCPWMMNAVSSTMWIICKYTGLHFTNHRKDVISNRHLQATSTLVSQCIKTKLTSKSATFVTILLKTIKNSTLATQNRYTSQVRTTETCLVNA